MTHLAPPVLPLRWLRLHAVALGPVRTGHVLNLDLRGTLGLRLRLRQKACPNPGVLRCPTCPDAAPCVYRLAFEVPGAPGRPPPKSGQAPRPYLLRAPLDARRLQPGAGFAFDVLLLGPLAAHAAAVVDAFAVAQEAGLGDVRARFRLAEVAALDLQGRVTAAVPHSSLRRSTAGLGNALALAVPSIPDGRRDGGALDEITVRFLTPTWIERRGAVERVPTLPGLVDAIGRRVRALVEAWGEPPGSTVRWPDATGAGEIVHWDGGWQGTGRRSRHQDETEHRIEGFVGEVRYRGRVRPLLPWLRLGELLHVGSNTPFGSGWLHLLDGDHERLARVVGLDGAWPPPEVVRARGVQVPVDPAMHTSPAPEVPPTAGHATHPPMLPATAPRQPWPAGGYVVGDVLRVDRSVLDVAQLSEQQRAVLRDHAAWLLAALDEPGARS